MAYCEICQAWSHAPNDHTTGFHDAALLSGTSYCLPSTHLFRHHCTLTPTSTTPNGHGTSAPVLNISASVPGGGITGIKDLAKVANSKATPKSFNFLDFHF